jgi:hypothetical protein
MAKRQKLNYNSEELTHHLKQSTGQGVDALFSPLPPTPSPTSPEEPGQDERNENIQTRTRARTHAREQASKHPSIEQALRKRISMKKHLSSFTFRFQAGELEALDRVTEEINRNRGQKTSKNDVIRLALIWLLQDHEENKDDSMLARVLASL